MRLLVALLLVAFAAGCTAPSAAPADVVIEAEPPGRSEEGAPAERPQGLLVPPAPGAGWPPLEEATIRPGVRLYEALTPEGRLKTQMCTANFVFRSLDNASLYLGTAAHCVGSLKLGDPVAIDGVDGRVGASGTLAYSSFIAMNVSMRDLPEPLPAERDAPRRDNNDFALIRIDEAHRALVHPATLRFGGPTALASVAGVEPGVDVLAYGSSATKRDASDLHWSEGCVVGVWPRSSQVQLVPPLVQGDSGGPILTAAGAALGLLTHAGPSVTLDPPGAPGGTNHITNLEAALAYAKEAAGIEVELATWPLLDTSTRLPPSC